jgi:hypothetical protein
MSHKYSVDEIDRMRETVRRLLTPKGGGLYSYNPEQRTKEIEERLRTYMLNGTEPSELEKSAEDYCISCGQNRKACNLMFCPKSWESAQ